jgi:hypothetical protein
MVSDNEALRIGRELAKLGHDRAQAGVDPALDGWRDVRAGE